MRLSESNRFVKFVIILLLYIIAPAAWIGDQAQEIPLPRLRILFRMCRNKVTLVFLSITTAYTNLSLTLARRFTPRQ